MGCDQARAQKKTPPLQQGRQRFGSYRKSVNHPEPGGTECIRQAGGAVYPEDVLLPLANGFTPTEGAGFNGEGAVAMQY
jgi:hypothetical protein